MPAPIDMWEWFTQGVQLWFAILGSVCFLWMVARVIIYVAVDSISMARTQLRLLADDALHLLIPVSTFGVWAAHGAITMYKVLFPGG